MSPIHRFKFKLKKKTGFPCLPIAVTYTQVFCKQSKAGPESGKQIFREAYFSVERHVN